MLQGSTNVYAKKVEYLYELVQNAMISINGGERMGRKQRDKQEKEGEKTNVEKEEEEALFDKWLPLDDLLEKTTSSEDGLKMNPVQGKERNGKTRNKTRIERFR